MSMISIITQYLYKANNKIPSNHPTGEYFGDLIKDEQNFIKELEQFIELQIQKSNNSTTTKPK